MDTDATHKSPPGTDEQTKRLRSRGFRMCVVGCVWLGIWQLASMAVGSALLLPGPVAVLVAFGRIAGSAELASTVLFSAGRIVAGFLAAFGAALVLAGASFRWRLAHELLAPAVAFLKSVPVVCIIVLLLLWVGSAEVSRVAVFLAVFPALFAATEEALFDQDTKLQELWGVFGVRRWRRVLADTWQQVLPVLVGTCKNACGMAWKAGVAAEVIGNPMGSLGQHVSQSRVLLETADLFAWTLVILGLSWVFEQVFLALLRASGPVAARVALLFRRVPEPAGLCPATLEIAGVDLGWPAHVVARDMYFEVAKGAHVVVQDRSGSGKTTLLHYLVMQEQGVRRGWVSQESRLQEELSAEQNVALCTGGTKSSAEIRELLEEILEPEALSRPVATLSGGQRRRVEVVRALAYPSQAILMDEPFSALDDTTRAKTAAFVLRHLAGRTLLVASHNTQDAELLEAQARCVFSA